MWGIVVNCGTTVGKSFAELTRLRYNLHKSQVSPAGSMAAWLVRSFPDRVPCVVLGI